MNRLALLVLTLCLAAPMHAQTPISAPAGWTQQDRGKGAHTYAPPDLRTGEVYSVTVYDSAPMNGATLEAYLRAFAGPVGKTMGQLQAPLKIETREGRFVTGSGVYQGPNNTALEALFVGVTLDGGSNIHVMRTLFSGSEGLLERTKAANETLTKAFIERASAETGDNLQVTPSVVKQKLATIGGALEPGVYAGNQYDGQQLRQRFRVYLYPTGEYRLCDENDRDIQKRYFDEQVGDFSYSAVSGRLNIDWTQALGFYSDDCWCYFGRDANGKAAIYAEDNTGFSEKHTLLTWVAPPTKRLAPSQEKEAKAAAQAEANRFKWTTAPGKGVPNAQIAAILLDSHFNGQSLDETVYLLLKDGTVYADLPVPPDELDVARSRQKEPDKWGKWHAVGGAYKVSWNGGAPQTLPGAKVLPAPAQLKLQGRWGTGTSSNNIITSSYSLWGVTFTKGGRFKKDRRGGASSSLGFGENATNTYSQYDDEGSWVGANTPGVVISSETKKKNPNGAREGDYSFNGWVLTLRYDNGTVKRLPFFFRNAAHEGLWFEGASMSLDKPEK